METEPVS